jgi:hypothetical protein
VAGTRGTRKGDAAIGSTGDGGGTRRGCGGRRRGTRVTRQWFLRGVMPHFEGMTHEFGKILLRRPNYRPPKEGSFEGFVILRGTLHFLRDAIRTFRVAAPSPDVSFRVPATSPASLPVPAASPASLSASPCSSLPRSAAPQAKSLGPDKRYTFLRAVPLRPFLASAIRARNPMGMPMARSYKRQFTPQPQNS